MAPLSQQLVEGLQAFPHDTSSLTGGRYTIQSTEAADVTADDHNVQTKVWFKSPVSEISIPACHTLPRELTMSTPYSP